MTGKCGLMVNGRGENSGGHIINAFNVNIQKRELIVPFNFISKLDGEIDY